MDTSNQKISSHVLLAIIATGIMSFCGVVVETAMNITFPTLMTQFNISTNNVQWMTTIYLLIVAIIVPLSATLQHTFKTKSLFLFANILFIIGVVLDSVAPTFPLLILGRMIQGVGTGIALPLMFNIILEQVPIHKIGTMMGIGTLITSVAPAIGPTFGGSVVSSIGWRYIFISLLPLLVISLILGIFNIEQKSKLTHQKFDFISFIFIIIGLTGLIFGTSNLGNSPFISINIAGAFAIGLVGIILFVWRSSKIDNPIIDVAIFKNLNFSGHVIAFFAIQMVLLGLAFLLPNYIQLVNHGTAILAGLVILPAALIGALFAPLGGRILDRYGAKFPLIFGSSVILLALLILFLSGTKLSDLAIGSLHFLFMIGIGLNLGNIMTNGLKQVDNSLNAHGNAVLNTVQQFAGAVGTSVSAALVASKQTSDVTLAHGTALGTHLAFTFLLVGIVIELIVIIKVVIFPFKNKETK